MQKDINKILEITKAGAWAIPKIGIYPCNGSYLSKVVFLKNWKQNELYVTELRGNLWARRTISEPMDTAPYPVTWIRPTDNNLYIHQLAVHPDQQGQGLAKTLMAFTELKSQTKQYDFIGLDPVSQHKRNQKFYELRGYKP